MNCPPGYSTDSILYIPARYGPFNEPPEANCYRNDLGVKIGAGIMISLHVIMLLILTPTIFHVRNKTMRYALGALELNTLLCIAFCICAIVAPKVCFFLWTASSFLIAVWFFYMAIVLLGDIVGTIAKIDKEAANKVSAGFNIYSYQTCSVIEALIILIGGLGVSISLMQNNIKLAMDFWLVHCIGWILAVTTGLIFWNYVCRKAADVIDEVSEKVSSNLEDNYKLRDTTRRFRKTGMSALALFPQTAGLWIVFATVLPAFYYMAFLQTFNVWATAAITVYFFTSSNDRKVIFNRIRVRNVVQDAGVLSNNVTSYSGDKGTASSTV